MDAFVHIVLDNFGLIGKVSIISTQLLSPIMPDAKVVMAFFVLRLSLFQKFLLTTHLTLIMYSYK